MNYYMQSILTLKSFMVKHILQAYVTRSTVAQLTLVLAFIQIIADDENSCLKASLAEITHIHEDSNMD